MKTYKIITVIVMLVLTSNAFAQKEVELLKRIEKLSQGPEAINVNTSILISDPANIKLKNKLLEKADPNLLKGKRIAILSTDGVEEVELTFIYELLKERGATVDLIAPKAPNYPSQFAVQVPAIRETHILVSHYMDNAGWMKIDKFIEDVNPNQYDAVLLPGGAWNPDALRVNEPSLKFLKAMNDDNKLVGAICHGPQTLINAELVKGRKLTSWWSMQIDLTNAGGTVLDQPVVVDGNLITSRAPIDLADFLDAVVSKLSATKIIKG